MFVFLFLGVKLILGNCWDRVRPDESGTQLVPGAEGVVEDHDCVSYMKWVGMCDFFVVDGGVHVFVYFLQRVLELMEVDLLGA